MNAFSLDAFHEAYETEITDMTVREKTYRFYKPKSLDPFIDTDDLLDGFPLWAKLWEASWILADHMAATPSDPGKRVLEIGGGLGVVGIVAAACGHHVTLTEFDAHALAFTRANALLNGINDLEVLKLDWHRPDINKRYDTVIASEVVYKESDFQPIEGFFDGCLAPGGEIILASGMRNIIMAFFNKLSAKYHVRAQKKILRSEGDDDNTTIILARMRPK